MTLIRFRRTLALALGGSLAFAAGVSLVAQTPPP
jgi:hypothetical protein